MKERTREVYGVDPGNSTLKIFDGQELTVLNNVVALGRERRVYKEETGSLEEYIDVTIESNGNALGRYFVGQLAQNEGGSYLKIENQNGNSKADNQDTYIIALTGIALKLLKKHNKAFVTKDIILGGGLPTEEFYSSGAVSTFERCLNGKHTVTFNHPLYKIEGRPPKVELNVTNMITLPESAAAMINHVYDEEGQAIKGREMCLTRLIIVIDVGALTTDVSAMENNKSVGTLTFGIPKGLFNAIDRIIWDIENDKETKGYRVSRQKIIEVMLSNEYKIPYKRGYIDIKPYVEIRISELADETLKEVVRRLKKERPDIDNEAYITFSVGGSVIPMADQIKEYLTDLQLEIPDDPVGANAKGYYKAARQLLIELKKQENLDQISLV